MTGSADFIRRRDWFRPVRRASFELSLLSVAIAFIGWAMFATVQIANSAERSSDLSYFGTIRELDQTLQGYTPDSLAKVMTATPLLNGGELVIDTLAVTADTLTEPEFAVGGFARDQILAFNDAAVRRAVLRATTDSGRDVWQAPSVFRTIRGANGALRLADQADGSPMIVRSPYAESLWRDVMTADAQRSPALIGYQGYVTMAPGSTGTTRFNGRDCEVVEDQDRSLLYCERAFASNVRRFYDLAVTPEATGTPVIETYRTRRLWVDGKASTGRETAIALGSVVDLPSTGPFLVSGANLGILATTQWVNGRSRFQTQPSGTIEFFARAGRSAQWPDNGGPLVLSFDRSLSVDLDLAAKEFFNRRRDELDLMSVVIVDLNTGQVRAIAEPGRNRADDPLIAFEPRLVGSVVKPLIAAAILDRHEEARNLIVAYQGPTVDHVAGAALQKPFDNEPHGCGSRIEFSDFLRCSSNQYAAEFLFRSLQRTGFVPSEKPGAVISADILERSEVADGLADVFDVDAYSGRTAGRTVPFWDVPAQNGTRRVRAVTDLSLFPYESRPWLLPVGRNATPVDLLARYAFGGWENRWTLLGVAQSYSRIATGRPVALSFLRDTITDRTTVFSPSATRALSYVRSALREVGTSGTAAGMNDVLQRTLGNGVAIQSKTGTLNETNDGVAIKALALAIGTPTSTSADATLLCGFAIISYFDFNAARVRSRGAAALPSVHLEFATTVLPEVLRRHWNRVSGCTSKGGP